MNSPQISVVIPVYNSERHIARLLDTVKNQTFTDFEAIIVNDGSSDNSLNIIEEYCCSDTRFSCITQRNAGVSAARNTGIEKATGKYITFYDSDDTVPLDALEHLYSCVVNDSVDMVVGGRINALYSKKFTHKQTQKFVEKGVIDKFDVGFAYSFGVWNKLFKLDIINAYNVRFGGYPEDGIFLLSYLKYCKLIVGCDKVVYEYRKRPFGDVESLSQVKTHIGLESIMHSFSLLRKINAENMASEGISYGDNKLVEFDKALIYRLLNIHILDQYYRKLWQIEPKALELVFDCYEQYYNELSNDLMAKLNDRHYDLSIANGLLQIDEITNKPEVAIVITKTMINNPKIYTVISSIYDQVMPYFVIYAPESLKSIVGEKLNYANIIYIKAFSDEALFKKVVAQTNANYILLVDEFVVFERSMIRSMLKKLKQNSEFVIAMAEPHSINDEFTEIKKIKPSNEIYKKVNLVNIDRENEKYDLFHVNKLVSLNWLKQGNNVNDFLDCKWDNLVQEGNFVRVKKTFAFVKRTTKDIKNDYNVKLKNENKLVFKMKRKFGK